MRRFALTLLVLLTGCSQEPLYYYVSEPLEQYHRDAIDDAEALLGVELIRSRSKYGAVHIQFKHWSEMRRVRPAMTAEEALDYMPADYREYGNPDATGRAFGTVPHRSAYGCKRRVKVSDPNWRMGETIAHEIGHAFRLEHSGGSEELMSTDPRWIEGEDGYTYWYTPEGFDEQDTFVDRTNAFARLCMRG